MEFGISGKKQVQDLPPFQPNEDVFGGINPCYLTDVRWEPENKNNKDEIVPTLFFEFRQFEGKNPGGSPENKPEREFLARFYTPTEPDHVEWANDRIQAIYETFGEIDPAKGLGKGAKDFAAFAEAIVKAFNGKNKELYINKPIWLKLTASKGFLNLPFRNFIQPRVAGKATTLTLNAKDVVDVRKTVSRGANPSTQTAAPTSADGGDNAFNEFK